MRRLRCILVASFVLIVVIPMSYFAVRYSRRPTFLLPEQVVAEYRAEAALLVLAPGWEWPVSPLAPVPDGTSIMYEEGWGKNQADFYWFCSWASRTVDLQLPADARQQALENVLSLQSKYFFTNGLSADSKAFYVRMLRNAADGDMDELRGYYELNCRQDT